MPKKIHDKLIREGRKKGLKGEKLKAYVYGTLGKLDLIDFTSKKKGKK